MQAGLATLEDDKGTKVIPPPHPGTHPPGLLSLHIHTAQTPGKSTVGTDAELLTPCALFHVDPQGAYPPRTSQVSCFRGSLVVDGSFPFL